MRRPSAPLQPQRLSSTAVQQQRTSEQRAWPWSSNLGSSAAPLHEATSPHPGVRRQRAGPRRLLLRRRPRAGPRPPHRPPGAHGRAGQGAPHNPQPAPAPRRARASLADPAPCRDPRAQAPEPEWCDLLYAATLRQALAGGAGALSARQRLLLLGGLVNLGVEPPPDWTHAMLQVRGTLPSPPCALSKPAPAPPSRAAGLTHWHDGGSRTAQRVPDGRPQT